jgi:hypothetical protein
MDNKLIKVLNIIVNAVGQAQGKAAISWVLIYPCGCARTMVMWFSQPCYSAQLTTSRATTTTNNHNNHHHHSGTTATLAGQRRPTQANKSQQRPTPTNEGQRAGPTRTYDGMVGPGMFLLYFSVLFTNDIYTSISFTHGQLPNSNEGQRRPTRTHKGQHRPTGVQHRPTQAYKGQRRQTAVMALTGGPTQANKGQRGPMQANEDPRRPISTNGGPMQANAGLWRPTRTHKGQHRPTQANEDPQRPTQVNKGQRRCGRQPGPNDVSVIWACRYITFYRIFSFTNILQYIYSFISLRHGANTITQAWDMQNGPKWRVRLVVWADGKFYSIYIYLFN